MRLILEEYQTLYNDDKIYRPDQIKELLQRVRKHFRFAWSNKKLKYFNVPAAFDIETSSFQYNGHKAGCMYEWTLGIYGCVNLDGICKMYNRPGIRIGPETGKTIDHILS